MIRQATCPRCHLLTHVRSSGLFIVHNSDRERHIRCDYSLGVSDLPDLRQAPTRSRVDVIRARAKAVSR